MSTAHSPGVQRSNTTGGVSSIENLQSAVTPDRMNSHLAPPAESQGMHRSSTVKKATNGGRSAQKARRSSVEFPKPP
jgi:hypothetical protein